MPPTHHDRHGAKQPERFDPARAGVLDDPARFEYLPPADLIALLDAAPGSTVVDFGAGTGTYAIALAQARPDLRILALDEQPEMHELLRRKIAETKVANVEPLEPAGLSELHGRVDRVLALNVFHELGDAALQSLRELLAPDGLALVVDWNADVEHRHGPPRAHVYGVDDARARLGKAGFVERGVAMFREHYALVVAAR